MTDTIDLVKMFEGLTPDGARQLTTRIRSAVERETKSFRPDPGYLTRPPELGNFPEWLPGDGPTPFVWGDRPPGHRCAWACHWLTLNPSNGKGQIITPAEWGLSDPGHMTDEQIAAELQDNFFDMLIASRSLAGGEGMLAASLDWHIEVEYRTPLLYSLLAAFRQSYSRTRAFINPYDPPTAGVFKNIRRPGWG